MSYGFLGTPPLVKEIQDVASNRPAGNRQSPGKIMKEQPIVVPVDD
jgi:hypothetical protein